MKNHYRRLLSTSPHIVWSQSALLGLMFLLFVSNAIGLLEIKGDLLPGIQLNPEVFDQKDTLRFPGVM